LEAYLQYMVEVARILGSPDQRTVRKEMQEALQVEIDLANVRKTHLKHFTASFTITSLLLLVQFARS
jgi:hypothetical protein